MSSEVKQNLEKLIGIKDVIIPKGSFYELMDRLSSLKVCFSLIEDDLKNTALCPHCNFNPQDGDRPVFGELDAIEDAMDKLYADWEKRLVNVIEDPEVRQNIVFLKREQQNSLKPLIEDKRLPQKIDGTFISAINDLVEGLEKLEVTLKDIENKVFGNGPSTVEDLKKRFMDFIDEIVRGKDAARVRIILK